MPRRTIIILAILVVYIATAIMARRLYNDALEEDSSLQQRRSDLSRLLRTILADKRRAGLWNISYHSKNKTNPDTIKLYDTWLSCTDSLQFLSLIHTNNESLSDGPSRMKNE